MPIYEYTCDNCAHGLEVLQKISDARLIECPECSSNSLRRLVSGAAFKLQGTGWYETDFKETGKEKAAAPDGKKDKPDSGVKEAKSDSSDAAPKKDGTNS